MHPTDPRKNHVKLTNFTLTHRMGGKQVDNDRRLPVPVRYCAPEILRSAGQSYYSEYSDTYSMSVLMWEAWSNGKRPYQSSTTSGEVRQRKLNNEKLTRPVVCDSRIWHIMYSCWGNSPEVRYKFEDMKQLLSAIDPTSLENYEYELDVNVRKKHSLNGINGRFYEAKCTSLKNRPVILIIMNNDDEEREALLYVKLNSSIRIVHTFGYVKNNLHSVMLLQERAPHGNLQSLLQNGKFQPSVNVLRTIFLQIVDAMIYMTNQHIIHGDLRCANVLVFLMDPKEPISNSVKLTNFRFSRLESDKVTKIRLPDGPLRYLAPEIVLNGNESNYSELSDVYSMGLLMWEACSNGQIPYGSHTKDRDIREQKKNDMKLVQPKQCPNNLWTIIGHCLLSQPETRYEFKGIQICLQNLLYQRCHHCDNDISEYEMNDHQRNCISPFCSSDTPRVKSTDKTRQKRKNDESHEDKKTTFGSRRPSKLPHIDSPSIARRGDFNDGYEDDEIRTYHKPPPPIQITASTPYPACKYCNETYPPFLLDEHQRLHCPRKPSSVIKKEPQPSYSRCVHCSKQFLNDELANHQRACPSIIDPFYQFKPNERRDTSITLKTSTSTQPSLCSRILSCFSCC
ncbi:hypothetical protein I4U23_020120 [Adineta vaga]|nr:hypothetical protein I4U23_020120 [Adineta vaga]